MSQTTPGRFLRWLIKMTDAILRRISGVTVFEAGEEGLLRIAVSRAGHHVDLSDGSAVRRGDAVVDLHLWNEHFPPFPGEDGQTGWMGRVQRQLAATLHRLALHIAKDPALDRVPALRMVLSIAKPGQSSVLGRLLLGAGFEPAGPQETGMGVMLRFLDSFWVWLLTWTYNPRALAGWRFDRTRREFWISRARLFALHGAAAANGAEARHVPAAPS